MLGPLQNNGGPTSTLALLSGPGIGAGLPSVAANAGLTTDQRGLPRTLNGSIDVGAYQNQTGSSALSFATQPAGTTVGSSLGSITVSDLSGKTAVAGTAVTIALSSGTLIGTTTAVTNASGIATFSGVSVSLPGTYTLTAASHRCDLGHVQFVHHHAGDCIHAVVHHPTGQHPGRQRHESGRRAGQRSGRHGDLRPDRVLLRQRHPRRRNRRRRPDADRSRDLRRRPYRPGHQPRRRPQYVETPNLASSFPGNSTSITIGVWFNAAQAGDVVDELGQTTPSVGWHDAQIEILANGTVMDRVWQLGSVTLGVVSFNTWHYAVVHYNAATQTLDGFLDGVQSTTTVSGIRSFSSSGALYYAFGSPDYTNLGSGAYLKGSVQDISIYNRALFQCRVPDPLYRHRRLCRHPGQSQHLVGHLERHADGHIQRCRPGHVFRPVREHRRHLYTVGHVGYGHSQSTSFIIAQASVAALSFTTQPAGTTAGSTMSPVVVQAADAYGNLVPGLAVKLSVSSGTLNGTLTATTNASGLATFSGLSDTTAGTYTLTATAGTVTGLSSSFIIATASVATLSFTTQPASITAGNTVGPVVVKADDSFGNLLPGTVVSLSISAGTLKGTLTATANAAGLATFAGLSDTAAGTYTLTATSGTVTTLSSQFIITPAAAAKLTFTAEPPATITANSAFAAAVQVTDPYGNLVPNAGVTLTPSSGTLTGTKTVTSDATGTATFGGLAISTVGTNYTLTATAGTLTAQSISFNITPGPWQRPPSPSSRPAPRPVARSAPVTSRATDSFGNTIANASIAVSISGTLNGTTTLATGATGLALFNNLSIDQAGTYTITATSGTATTVSQSFVIAPAAAATLAWTIAPVAQPPAQRSPRNAVNVVDHEHLDAVPKTDDAVISEVFKTSEICTLNGTTSVNAGTTGPASFVTLSMTKAAPIP